MQTRYNSLDRATLDVSKMSGIEYYTWHSDVVGQVFHLLKQYKYSNTHATPMAAYYILQGNVYQAPDLQALLSSRLRTCLHHLTAAYEEYSAHVRFHPAQGYIWGTSASSLESSVHSLKDKPAKKILRHHKKRTKSNACLKRGEDGDVDSFLEAPVENTFPLLSAQFVSRVDMLIAENAEKQHVVLLEKPPTPEEKLSHPSTLAKETHSTTSALNARDTTKEASETSSMVGGGTSSKRKRSKKDLDLQSDIASLGGESTKSKKKKKQKKEKSVKSPTISV
ncbi:Mediator of RNA polymerase II transcription subunit 6 [Coelomomyces lativittatus]|nr:Mediator of RNA polymerase II transcription subunit 6 [Coelomomyces lativittatus]